MMDNTFSFFYFLFKLFILKFYFKNKNLFLKIKIYENKYAAFLSKKRPLQSAGSNSSFSSFSSFWSVPVRKTHPAAKVQLPGKFCERKFESGEKFSSPLHVNIIT